MKIAIIGAGIAGLACAEEAAKAGHDVVLFDKARGAGGRLSTRRAETHSGILHFDHGTLGFSAQSEAFFHAVSEWRKAGFVDVWSPRAAKLSVDQAPEPTDVSFWVGIPGMNGLLKGLASGKNTHFSKRAVALERKGAGWSVHFENGSAPHECDVVISAIPLEQANEFLSPVAPDFANAVSGCHSLPVFSVMLAFEDTLDMPFDFGICDHPTLKTICRNSAKPHRNDEVETIVLHATTDWSGAHVDDDKEAVSAALMDAFFELTGIPTRNPTLAMAHRWLYGLNGAAKNKPCIWNSQAGLGVCGDWLIGPDVEHAWLSGTALGKAI